ncbi:hypothetical protein Sjap_022931 [Stephania japonica]|uniref:KOW domain-containing protein n=1 Tax=Stephania japonica TaxID=461633 RepID=A0AAP0EYK9_9MAGN
MLDFLRLDSIDTSIVAIYGSTSLFALWIASTVVGAIDAIPLACRGLFNIYSAKPSLVPIKEMTDVLSVETKAIDISRDTWVRMKNGMYKGDLAKVVDVDDVGQKVTVKLIPRIDFQELANKLELHIRVEHRRDPRTGDYYESIGGNRGMMFKDGFLLKTVAMKSISTTNVEPNFDELEKFRNPEDGDGDMANLSTLLANRKKDHFMRGDAITVVRTLAVNEKDLCKYFKPGDHVKVVSGAQEGATGTVVKVEGHVLILVSDTTKDDIRVFADNVVRSSEVTTGITE